MIPLERADGSRRVGLWSLLGLLLVPLVLAGGFLAATWKSTDRLDRVQAAVVNLDEPVTIDKQLVPLGRQLAGGLVDGGSDGPPSDTNFSWVLTDADDASSGLGSGRYAAVVTIPKDFSANATSYRDQSGDTAQQAVLDVQTSPVSGVTDPVVGQAITAAATRALNSQLTEQYVQNVFVGFNTTKRQFTQVADAAEQLSDGTSKLAHGLDQTSDGTAKLSDGLNQLDDGGRQLAGGARQLSSGLGQLDAGGPQLASGARRLSSGLDQLDEGGPQLARGTRQLSDGLHRYADGVGRLAEQTKALPGAARRIADGASQSAKGADQLAQGTDGLVAGLRQYRSALRSKADAIPLPAQGQQVVASCLQDPASDPTCRAVLLGYSAGAKQSLEGVADGLDQKDPRSGQSLVGGAERLAGGQRQAAAGFRKLAGGADQFADGIAQLPAGIAKLDAGASGLASGAGKLSTGVGQYTGGVHKIADGAGALSSGVGQYTGGVHQIAGGAGKLGSGVEQYTGGVHKIADGAGGLSTGIDQYTGGVHGVATGATQLSSGLVKLSAGADRLADGTQKLSDGLAKGAKQIPTYDKAARERLSAVVATPVTTPEVTSVFSNVATTTLLAVLALWVGGLASYLVLRAVSAKALSSMKSSWRLTLESLLPAAVVAVVQAVVLTVLLHALLDLSAGRTVRLLGLSLLAGLVFVALNQALVAWFGGVGRFVSLVLVVLTAAAALTSAVPHVFDTVTPFLPLTPALQGMRAVVTGVEGSGGPVGLLIAWLVVGLAAGVLATARHRVLPSPALAADPAR